MIFYVLMWIKQTFNSFFRTCQTWEMKRAKRLNSGLLWMRVWESSGLMPRLCCCAQKLSFYIPLGLMRTVLWPDVVILTNWAFSFSPFPPHIFKYKYSDCYRVNLDFSVSTLQNYNTEHSNRISWEWSKWSLTQSKSVSTGKMVLKNPTIRLVNFTNGNDFF